MAVTLFSGLGVLVFGWLLPPVAVQRRFWLGRNRSIAGTPFKATVQKRWQI
ncbi:MAG: hypothetical protein OES79_05105 [Planctomycetota bacterium]|nr:hypothetical protein [Planctomycetota bacterium]